MKRLSLFLLFAVAALTAARPLSGQAVPTASRNGGELQAGVTYSNANSDEVSQRIAGISAYATYGVYKHLAIEADLHFLSVWTPQDFAEQSYMAGVRYSRNYRRYQPYVKVLGGITQTVAQQPYVTSFVPHTPEHFAAFAVGGGLDVRLSHHINLRAIDYEQQFWKGFSPNGLTPGIVSVGAAYRFR